MNYITLRDIRKGHPFGVSSPTDADYVRISKAVFDRLRYTPFGAERSEEELKRIAIKLTMYFEDIVSEIDLWHSLVQKHQQLYGKPLPFYHVEKDYTPDEPHIKDIQFLLWDSTLDDEYSDTLVNPENEESACKDIANEIDSYSKLESISVKVCSSTNEKQENRTNISISSANNKEMRTGQNPNPPKKPQLRNKWKNGKR